MHPLIFPVTNLLFYMRHHSVDAFCSLFTSLVTRNRAQIHYSSTSIITCKLVAANLSYHLHFALDINIILDEIYKIMPQFNFIRNNVINIVGLLAVQFSHLDCICASSGRIVFCEMQFFLLGSVK